MHTDSGDDEAVNWAKFYRLRKWIGLLEFSIFHTHTLTRLVK